MKNRNNVDQLHPEVDMENAFILKTEQIGNSKIQVYTEKSYILQTKNIEYDFGFLINGEYYRGNENFTIAELYKVYNTVYSSFIEFIENTVLEQIKDGLPVDIIVSACAADEEEESAKNKLYKKVLKKISNKYNCSYKKHENMYVLSFTK